MDVLRVGAVLTCDFCLYPPYIENCMVLGCFCVNSVAFTPSAADLHVAFHHGTPKQKPL
jgi:hypothetical protein